MASNKPLAKKKEMQEVPIKIMYKITCEQGDQTSPS